MVPDTRDRRCALSRVRARGPLWLRRISFAQRAADRGDHSISHMLVVNSVKWPPRTISINKTPKLIYASERAVELGLQDAHKFARERAAANGDFNVWERSEEAWELLRVLAH